MPDSFTHRIKNHLKEIDAQASIQINTVDGYIIICDRFCKNHTLHVYVHLPIHISRNFILKYLIRENKAHPGVGYDCLAEQYLLC